MAANVIDVTDANFNEEVIESTLPVLVDFWAPWCGPCRAIAPVLVQLADEYEGRVKVAKVNVDSSPEAASRFQIRSIPSLILMRDGKVVGQLVGAVGKGKLEELLQKVV